MNTSPLTLPKYSIGVGDRFAHQAKAQLQACVMAAQAGVDVIPVWNKSNREHTIIGSEPAGTRTAATHAVTMLGWTKPYFVDADHINLSTVDRFLEPCDFFTIDVADLIGEAADPVLVDSFISKHLELTEPLNIPGLATSFHADRPTVEATANKFLGAVSQAGEIYRYIASKKGTGCFITEISMDETDSPQTPMELLIILAAIAGEGIPIQTVAPKFTGRFNKGVDYAGDLARLAQELSDDMAVIAYAVERYRLPANLKLSIHSGSDKFSIYPPIRDAMLRHDAGLHLKTAGTTWLEELIGLAESDGAGLDLAKDIYAEALAHRDELCGPYASVIDVDARKLPGAEEVRSWNANQFVSALRHVPGHPAYNSSFRQLLHVGFKVAARMGDRYLSLLEQAEDTISRNVTSNLFERHIKPLFIGA